jgi:MATE family multidrug resistance protein
MLRLAVPVVVAELGWTAMGTVDTLMVGRLSAEAIGAVSLGSAVFLGVSIFGLGLLLGLDTIISQAFGAGNASDCYRSLIHGVYAALGLTLPLSAVFFVVVVLLPGFGINEQVLALTIPYLKPVAASLLPLLLYSATRRFLQATGHVHAVMGVLLTANLVNALTNWLLIFGHWGFSAHGVVGAGWATLVSRIYMALALTACIIYYDRRGARELLETPLWIDRSRLRRLLDLGLPSAFHISLEMGLFAVATALAGRLDAASLAAHQIALSVAATTFMVPLGVSSAAAVRVGHAAGRRDAEGVRRGGWMAIVLGVGFMSIAMIVLFSIPNRIISLFTNDASVLDVGVSLLFVAALFQLFDGLQVVTTGVLRGLGETRTPMVVGLIGYWGLGLPTGYFLCFHAGLGVLGLWVGLAVGLASVGALLLRVWMSRLSAIAH